MKRIFYCCLLGIISITLCAQEDAGRVSISAVQPPYENIPEEARVNLETRMQRMLSACGLSNSASDRFVMTSRVNVNTREINTASMIVQRMDITFIIGDIIEEKVYGTTTINAMGIGETESKCFIKAFQSVKPNNPIFTAFIEKAKEDIVAYYTNNCAFIMQDAERMVNMQQYGEAIATLVSVPKVCTDCYTSCQVKASEIYTIQIELEGKQLIQDARSAWLVKRDYDCAEKALTILAKVNPEAQCQAEANMLIDEINTQLRKIEAAEAARRKAEWEFKLKQYEDKHALEVQKQADRAAILGTFANRFGRIDIGIKNEKAFKLGTLSK